MPTRPDEFLQIAVGPAPKARLDEFVAHISKIPTLDGVMLRVPDGTPAIRWPQISGYAPMPGDAPQLGALGDCAAAHLLTADAGTRFHSNAVSELMSRARAARPGELVWEPQGDPFDSPRYSDPMTGVCRPLGGPELLIASSMRDRIGGVRSWEGLARAVRRAGGCCVYVQSARVRRMDAYPARPVPEACARISPDVRSWGRRLTAALRGQDIRDAPFAAANGYRHPGDSFGGEVPLVSIIVRTIAGRTRALGNALACIQRQTYPRLEAIIVEDGSSGAAAVVTGAGGPHHLRHMQLAHVGRSAAGNAGLAAAGGALVGFLDDDDGLWPDHVETLVRALAATPEAGLAYALSLEFSADLSWPLGSGSGFRIVGSDDAAATIEASNPFPIQSVLFRKHLYENYGGFDSSLSALEDWDLWRRYARHTRLLSVGKITSLFRVPGSLMARRARARTHATARGAIRG